MLLARPVRAEEYASPTVAASAVPGAGDEGRDPGESASGGGHGPADSPANVPAEDSAAGPSANVSAEDEASTAGPPATAPAEDEASAARDGGEASTGRQPFHLRPSDLYVGIEGDYERRTVRSAGFRRPNSAHRSSDLRLREVVGLSLDGDLYDPNLLSYQADLRFGLEQTRFDERFGGIRQSESDDGFLHEYDVTFDALQTKPISLHGYARRFEQRIPRRFLPSLREMQTEAGASALIVAGSTTTEIGLSWRNVERTGNRLDADDEELEVTRFYLDHTVVFSDNHRLRAQFEHGREESTYQGSGFRFDTRRDEVRLEDEITFGPGGKHRLDTFFRYNEEQGDLARDELELVPRLALQHTDKLQTIYRYGFYRFEQDALEVAQHKFDIQALYKATDDLRFAVDGYGLYEQADLDTETYEFGGSASTTYHRATSMGELNMNAGLGFDSARTTGDAGRRWVRGEAHAMGGARPTYLRQRDIVSGTIVAHDARRGRYYLPVLDYQIIRVGPRIRIRRVPTGRITENEAVYFDYQYTVPIHGSVRTFRGDFLIEHTFNFGLTPYYGYEGRSQDVNSSRGDPRERDNTHRHRLGVRYVRDRWEVGTELELFDDTVEPYDAWHLTGRANLLRQPNHSLDLSGELSRYWFEGGVNDRRVWWLDMDLKDRLQINPFLSLLTGAAFRWEDDSVDGKTHGVDVECGLQYTRGYLTVDLTLEYDLLSIASNREAGFGVFLNVRRNLSHLLPSSKGGGG